ncbi:MAG: DNRLRE domain-containing protein [Proteobacteria bacterium]|nr:DNRLRE domain-containing protein [Pseudomonadota bacterium]
MRVGPTRAPRASNRTPRNNPSIFRAAIKNSTSWKNRTNDDWLQSGADFDVDPLGSAVVGTTAENWISWDVTSALRASLAGRLPNAGLILLPPSGTDNIKFYSSNVDAASDRPKLVIDYACECGQTCPGL